jgi:predicted transcriptional regulator
MSPTGKGKHDIKISMDIELYKLIKKIAGVSDTSMNALINRAVEQYVETDEIRAVIDRYRLEDDEDSE